jgi:pimeloyl-ACP methyl ester carboxylesterase
VTSGIRSVGLRRPGVAVLAALIVFVSGWPVATVTAAAAAVSRRPNAAASIRLGDVSLPRCHQKRLSYCGQIAVPLDYSSPASPDIKIGFRWLPATRTRHPAGTILAVEGGPGFSSTGSQSLYVAMSGPLLRSRNMLLINLRGTGNSTTVDCRGLERAGASQYGARFNRLVAACGRQLNHTWRYRGGGWVHASDLFNTAYSARDVATVLRHLKPGRIDLYGDSYGSWFSQVFASRYPGLLRSVTLDSTYQVLGLDPWYTTTVVTARRAFNAACRLSRVCARAAPAWTGRPPPGWSGRSPGARHWCRAACRCSSCPARSTR